MSMESPNTMMIKLLVDKENNKVLYAECGKAFVDVLLSFLTLPIGTIIRLNKKQSKLGCMDALYQSVESLDTDYFETEACKTMLLKPRSSAEHTYKDLEVDICNSAENLKHYTCPTWTCVTKTHRLLSLFHGAPCLCGLQMDEIARIQREYIHNDDSDLEEEEDNEVGFVKGTGKFAVMDDLRIRAVSDRCLRYPCGYDITKPPVQRMEARIVCVSQREVLLLLKYALISKTPMTDVFYPKQKGIAAEEMVKTEPTEYIKMEIEPAAQQQLNSRSTVYLKLFISKSMNRVVYAEANGDLLNFLFSFLAFPMGSVINLVDGCLSIGSMNNVHSSLKKMRTTHPERLLTERDHMLLYPKVAYHHGWEKQLLLGIEEEEGCRHVINKCPLCFDRGVTNYRYGFCMHGIASSKLNLINPKKKLQLPHRVCQRGGGFINKFKRFLITDDLHVERLSSLSTMCAIKNLGLHPSDLVNRYAFVGEQQALSILKTSLSSTTALTDVFCQKSQGSHSCFDGINHQQPLKRQKRHYG